MSTLTEKIKKTNQKPKHWLMQRNILSEQVNNCYDSAQEQSESPLSAQINERAPLSESRLPFLMESPLSALINLRKPVVHRDSSGPNDSPIANLINNC